MELPADDRCPRCGDTFHCGRQDLTPCPCSTLTLAPETLAALRQRYAGCLCLRCLAGLAAGEPAVSPGARPRAARA